MTAHRHRPIAFGLNRLDVRSPALFAASATHLQALGWNYGFIPSSPLLVQDPYVLLARALEATDGIVLGPLIENPVMRHPAVIAGSIATVDRIAPGRTLLGLGVGDTAVRLMGKRPATVAMLEQAIETIRALNRGEALSVGAARPARLNHGPFPAIREQLQAILGSGLPIEIVVPHPVPTPVPGGFDYARAFAEQVIAKL